MTEYPHLPYPYLRIGHLNAPPLLGGIGTAIDLGSLDIDAALRAGLDFVSFSPESGYRIEEQSLAMLTACEAVGVPTVLRVAAPTDLDTQVAAVVSHIAATDVRLLDDVRARVGPERTLLAEDPIDPRETLLADRHDPASNRADAVSRRRDALATRSPRAVADRLLAQLGIPVDPPPLVTVLIVTRSADHLDNALANLRRQAYPRTDPLLVVDPLHAPAARDTTAEWDLPVRVVTAAPRSTLADRLNIGIQHAHGEVVAIFEEKVRYGPYHLVDSVQALEHSGAQLVGRAGWFVYDAAADDIHLKHPRRQRSFGEELSVASMVLRRTTAQKYGFVRRASGINWPIRERVQSDGGNTYSIHAFDMLVSGRGTPWHGKPPTPPWCEAFPFESRPAPPA